jgi:ribonuclease G
LARSWFRFGKKRQEDAAADSPAREVATPPESPAVTEPAEPEGAAAELQKKRRRRGSRGGRGRKKTTTGTAVASAAPAEEPAKVAPARTESARKRSTERGAQDKKSDRRSDRKSTSRTGRRRTATRRTTLPEAKRELLITVDVGEQRVAVLEDDRVAEVYLERPERRSIAGNIYLGVVDNVLPGMEAAFVEIGLEKNGFLYVDEIVGPELEGRKGARKIQDLIKRGQVLLVQAVKDPMKSKGARLTTEISLPGRFLVYVPNGEGYGVSRRLDDAERTRLKDIVKDLDAKGGGIIVRTAADGASAEDIERDLVFLQRLWKTIQAKAGKASAPELVYEEAELPLRIVRDLFAGDFVSARIDDDRTHRRIVSYLKKTSPHMIERVHRYKEKEPLFEASGVDAEIRSTLDRRVDLPSGGYLIFDYAEAFTVIDVNTGRFVGSRAKTSAGRLEDTIVKNNLEAVKEVVRQLRLRDIGGIIVIDFIDMANPKNRETVEEALRTELERDRTKTYVVEISPLGLVEMTRQNVTDGPREILTNRCPICEGDGFVVSDATFALEIERKLRALAKGSRVQAFKVALHPRVLPLVIGPAGSRLEAIEGASRRRFFLVPAENGHVHLDHFEVLGQGKLDAYRPGAPVEEGANVELKLVEVGLHDLNAGVGKVEGYDVVVAGAAKLVGKKVDVTIGRALEGAAYAALSDGSEPTTPITFEAEAEKPTRASRAKPKAAEEQSPESDADVDGETELEAVESGGEAETEEEAEVEEAVAAAAATERPADDPDAPPKKKRTRRGTRGGRRRKKPAVADASGNGAGPEELEDAEAAEAEAAGLETAEPLQGEPAPKATAPRSRRQPRIHVPQQDPDESGDGEVQEAAVAVEQAVAGTGEPADAATATKKTRRGTRGGRKRRKPPQSGEGVATDAAATEDAAPALAPSGEEASQADGEAPGEYVPMSEWIEDFDARTGSGRR